MPKNKFDALDKADLLKLCLEQEQELENLRPKPPKFKLGQLICNASGGKNPWMRGQPAIHFVVLSVENRAGEWHYGYSQLNQHSFNVFPEKKLRALTKTELDGTPSENTPVPNFVIGTGTGLAGTGAHGLMAHDIETDPQPNWPAPGPEDY